jgi:antitoxin component of MazEF toxin-antitoxin module
VELSDMIEQKHLSVRKLERMIAGGHSLRETIEERGDSLYVKLPRAVAELVNISAGDSVYVYVQTRRRIAVERCIPEAPIIVKQRFAQQQAKPISYQT